MALREYVAELKKNLAQKDATELTHRRALQNLIESLADKVHTVSEPKATQNVGRPDIVILRGNLKLGHVETKDIGADLKAAEKTDQLARYRDAFPNLILTDYLDFYWYTDGVRRASASLGSHEGASIKPTASGAEEVEKLLSDFIAHGAKMEFPNTPKELAERMARLTRMTRDIMLRAYEEEGDKGNLHDDREAFRETLLPELTPEQFTDMYAQTIAYGLFAARCTRPEVRPFTRQAAWELLPKTNPFLRNLFNRIAGPDLQEDVQWIVDELAALLDHTEMHGVLRNFGKGTKQKDPVIHFYETFLKAYDPKEKTLRGVYYTPEPVVDFIVRNVDKILKINFKRSDGLADKNTFILDPAAGTASFLHRAMLEIHDQVVTQKKQKGAWNAYISDHFLKRVFGFELQMAPYAVAHLKLGRLLQEQGYDFKSDERLGVYLTNTLDEGIEKARALPLARFITDESNAAAEIKNKAPIEVILGNPPYFGQSANKSEFKIEINKGSTYITGWAVSPGTGKVMPVLQTATKNVNVKQPNFIGKLLKDYYICDGRWLGERTSKWLQDDYVKFIRFAQWRIEKMGRGVLGFVTNHAYLDNPTFRGMRQSLMKTFNEIYILDLHGHAQKEKCPDGSKDENVFEIKQGVAIGIFIKYGTNAKKLPHKCSIFHADMWGLRTSKYYALEHGSLDNLEWKCLDPNSPFYFFVPWEEKGREEYEKGWKVLEVFKIHGAGMTTARDEFVFCENKPDLLKRILAFKHSRGNDDELHAEFKINRKQGWNIRKAWKMLQGVTDKNIEEIIVQALYRPFDTRWIAWHDAIVWRTVKKVMRHMLMGENIALITSRMTKGETFHHAQVTRNIVEVICMSPKTSNNGFVFPLYIYEGADDKIHHAKLTSERRPNLNPDFVKEVEAKVGKATPEDIFHYIYAVLHSPEYRKRYGEFLKIDFPRVPLTSDKKLFSALAALGERLVGLHLMESKELDDRKLLPAFDIEGSGEVEKVRYDEKKKRVYINTEQYFDGIPEAAWEFHIGGYRVLHKWLKYRKGRELSSDDVTHYQRVVVAIVKTMEIMKEIDERVGGWPIK